MSNNYKDNLYFETEMIYQKIYLIVFLVKLLFAGTLPSYLSS